MANLIKRVAAWPALLAVVAGLSTAAALPSDEDRMADVIVTGHPAAVLAEIIEAHGGLVTGRLDLVGGVTATLPADRLAAVGRTSAVAPDASVRVQGEIDGSGVVRSVYREATGAAALAEDGLSGAGVTVALVDTGVADVADVAGRVVSVSDPLTGEPARCVDLSGEGHCHDSYGHGTFMAGIILGDGTASDGRFVGMAPAADLVSIKVAGRDGSSDVSKVLAAIQWTVQNADRHGIRVLNLSLGTDSVQSWEVDPFNYAVQRAWGAGIVVVVSASNFGPAPGTIAKPGDDPWILTVGAVDDRGTKPAGDDRLPDFTGRGPTVDGEAKPDLVAPGANIVSLRAPGSAVDEQFPDGVDGSYRRGSGTSMAAAAVSGGAALLLERHPEWTPDQVKEALRSTAQPTGASKDPLAIGAGGVDVAAAADGQPARSTGSRPRSNGLGALDLSRGNVLVKLDNPLLTVLDSTLTAQMILWDPIGFTTGDWESETSDASTIGLHQWYGTTWHGNNWQGNNWQGNNWQGAWSGAEDSDGVRFDDTYGEAWLGAAWYGLWE